MGFNNGLIKINVSTINFLIFVYFLQTAKSTNFLAIRHLMFSLIVGALFLVERHFTV